MGQGVIFGGADGFVLIEITRKFVPAQYVHSMYESLQVTERAWLFYGDIRIRDGRTASGGGRSGGKVYRL